MDKRLIAFRVLTFWVLLESTDDVRELSCISRTVECGPFFCVLKAQF